MWDKLIKELAKFPSAVLTGFDAEGYPYSVRCIPQVDHARQVLLVQLSPEVAIQPGPAGLLCHSHDELLWNMKSFQVSGALEKVDSGWIFQPRRYIPSGTGNNPLAQIKMMINCRQTARRYLRKRNLPLPAVPWEEIRVLRAESKKGNRPS